jgi:hypothetical protein
MTSPNRNRNQLALLPNDAIVQIMKHLSIGELMQFYATSRRYRNIIAGNATLQRRLQHYRAAVELATNYVTRTAGRPPNPAQMRRIQFSLAFGLGLPRLLPNGRYIYRGVNYNNPPNRNSNNATWRRVARDVLLMMRR